MEYWKSKIRKIVNLYAKPLNVCQMLKDHFQTLILPLKYLIPVFKKASYCILFELLCGRRIKESHCVFGKERKAN